MIFFRLVMIRFNIQRKLILRFTKSNVLVLNIVITWRKLSSKFYHIFKDRKVRYDPFVKLNKANKGMLKNYMFPHSLFQKSADTY